MAISLIAGYIFDNLDTIINKATGNDTASFLAFNDDIMSTLVSKHNNYYELSYKHVCDNPQNTFDNLVSKLKNLDIIGADIGKVSKKHEMIQNNDLIAISWITNLLILPFKVSSVSFYNVLNVYETDDYLQIIFHSAANIYNSEYMNFTVQKDIQSVSIKMTYDYVPTNIYGTLLITTGILNFESTIHAFMLNTITHLYADDNIICNIQSLKRSIV
jgi:hypothetical protein